MAVDVNGPRTALKYRHRGSEEVVYSMNVGDSRAAPYMLLTSSARTGNGKRDTGT